METDEISHVGDHPRIVIVMALALVGSLGEGPLEIVVGLRPPRSLARVLAPIASVPVTSLATENVLEVLPAMERDPGSDLGVVLH